MATLNTSTKIVIALSLLVVILSVEGSEAKQKHTVVKDSNNAPAKNLVVHYKSKDDDLGIHSLVPGERHTVVKVSNNAPTKNLTVHCQSKNNDLGFHTLTPGQDFNFSFYPNVWYTTLFFCGIKWPDQPKTNYLDVYKGWRDRGCNRFWWKIDECGGYQFCTQDPTKVSYKWC